MTRLFISSVNWIFSTVNAWTAAQSFSGQITSSKNNAGPLSSYYVTAAIPSIAFNASGQASDTKIWDVLVNGTAFQIRAVNDANNATLIPLSMIRNATTSITAITFTGPTAVTAAFTGASAVAIPAGGTTGVGLNVSSTANFGVFFGSGAPSLSAAKGSLYLRSDGSGINDRMYVNTTGSTTWTAVVTVA